MKHEVWFAPTARAEILAPFEYIRSNQADPRNAARWLNGIMKAINRLSALPHAHGPARESASVQRRASPIRLKVAPDPLRCERPRLAVGNFAIAAKATLRRRRQAWDHCLPMRSRAAPKVRSAICKHRRQIAASGIVMGNADSGGYLELAYMESIRSLSSSLRPTSICLARLSRISSPMRCVRTKRHTPLGTNRFQGLFRCLLGIL